MESEDLKKAIKSLNEFLGNGSVLAKGSYQDMKEAFMKGVEGAAQKIEDEKNEELINTYNTLRDEAPPDTEPEHKRRRGGKKAPPPVSEKKKDTPPAALRTPKKELKSAKGTRVSKVSKEKKEKRTSFVELMRSLLKAKTEDKKIFKMFSELYKEKGKQDEKFVLKRIEIYRKLATK